eukprot:12883051-Prorocentrum_lima.AAC.1
MSPPLLTTTHPPERAPVNAPPRSWKKSTGFLGFAIEKRYFFRMPSARGTTTRPKIAKNWGSFCNLVVLR